MDNRSIKRFDSDNENSEDENDGFIKVIKNQKYRRFREFYQNNQRKVTDEFKKAFHRRRITSLRPSRTGVNYPVEKISGLQCVKTKKQQNSTLAVVDLDETLIDTVENGYRLYPGAEVFLKKLHQHAYVFLWTMGDEKHVQAFFQDYPECQRYIDIFKCGLVQGTKPVNFARQYANRKTEQSFNQSILIDDNQHHLRNGHYDHTFDVLQYLNPSHTSVDYSALWTAIRNTLDF